MAFFIFYLGFLRKIGIYQDGKNLINFIFIYQIGYGIRRFQELFQRKKKYTPIMMAIMLSIIGICYFIPDKNYTFIHSIVFLYKYNSPFLILLSALIFLTFLNLNIRSQFINYLATSSFSIYLIHEHPLFRKYAYIYPFESIKELGYSNDFTMFGICLTYSILLSFICMFIDKIRIYLFSLMTINKRVKQ